MRTFFSSIIGLYLVFGIICVAAAPIEVEGFTQEEIMTVQEILKIRAAQMDHHANSKAHTFASSLMELYTGEKASGLSFIDFELASGEKNGYRYRIKVNDKGSYEGLPRWKSWSLEAKPVEYGVSGTLSFFCDVMAKIRAEDVDGDWGNSNMPALPADMISQIERPLFREQEQGSHAINEFGGAMDKEVHPANITQEKASDHRQSAQSSNEGSPEFSQVIKETISQYGARVWSIVGISDLGNLWKKTDSAWEAESEAFRLETSSISSRGSGAIRGRFCWMIDNCVELEWGGKYAGIPHVKLFPADPILMRQLSDLYSPVVPKSTNSIESVFKKYEKEGRFRRLVREVLQINDDGSFIIANVPAGEWIAYGYLECKGNVWVEENRIPRHCDTWILFVNTEKDKTVYMENFFFGTRSNGIISFHHIIH